MYSISTEPKHKVIRAHLSGFFSIQEVAKFGDDVQAAARSMGCRSGEHLLYVDTSGCALQAQDVVLAFQSLIQNAPLKSSRIAIVTGSSLCRMQTRRILVRDKAIMFETGQDAEKWLLSGEDSQQAA
ncbi:MAG: hypothetical protein ACSLE1_07435 [Sphingobium sp.]